MTSRVFSTAEFAMVTGLREERAVQFLRDFEAQGIVERRLQSGWQVTRRGLRLSRELGSVAPTTARAA